MSKSKKAAKAKLAKADVKYGAVAVASKPPLLTAARIKKDCPVLVQDLGQLIAVHYDKLVQCEGKAEQHKIAMGKLLMQAKEACDAGGFTAFRERFCPNLGKSRAHELLLIASGKKTLEETKTTTRERVKKHRAAKKAVASKVSASSVTVTDEPAVIADKCKAEYVNRPKINGRIAAEPEAESAVAEPEAKPTVAEPEAEPTVEEAEAELKRLKALKAKINANMGDDAKIDRKASAKALAEFNTACATCLPKMHGNDLQQAIDGFAEVIEVPAIELMPDLRHALMAERIAKAEVTAMKRKLAGKLPPRESRAAAWKRLAGAACTSIEELVSMQQEFEEAKDNQPDSLQDGPFAQKCEEICGIDLESALSTLEEAESAEVPRGFGRD
jgi:hypothetical protein